MRGGGSVIKFGNCRLPINGELVWGDVLVNRILRKIISEGEPDTFVDVGGRILAPGFIDCQLKGAFGFNFDTFVSHDDYSRSVYRLNEDLVKTGVTSYLPTLKSQPSLFYKSVSIFVILPVRCHHAHNSPGPPSPRPARLSLDLQLS